MEKRLQKLFQETKTAFRTPTVNGCQETRFSGFSTRFDFACPTLKRLIPSWSPGRPGWAHSIIRQPLGYCRRCLARSALQVVPMRTVPLPSPRVQPM